MSNRKATYSSEPEASKVVARNMDLPQCEGLRACAALTSIVQCMLTTNSFPEYDLTIGVQIGFGLIGFMIAAYLLRDRDLTTYCESVESGGLISSIRGLLRSLPISQMAAVVAMVLLFPRMMAIEGGRIPDITEVPAIIVRLFSTYFSDFQKSGFDGKTLLMFPLVVLFVPRRCLSLVLLTVLASGLVLQFSGLFSGSMRPASILVSPSAFDLLSMGTLMAVISRQRRIGQSEAQIGLSALIAGGLMAGGLVVSRLTGTRSEIGAMTLFCAPTGFGVANFIVEIVGTTLVSSLWWRDLGGMIEQVNRAPAH
jgi:hypothetical protein